MRKTTEIDTFWGFDFEFLRNPMIVIYAYPSDFPNKYVARAWDADGMKPTEYAVMRGTYEEITKQIPERFNRLPDLPWTDPKIVGVYLEGMDE